MSKEEKFEFDIDKKKKDLAIEDMPVYEEDVALLRRYFNEEITMTEMVNQIKNSIIQEG